MTGERSANDELAALVALRAGNADEQASSEVTEETTPLLLLRLGDHWFGLRAESVREVVACDTVTSVPGQPAYVRGVALIHGRLVPVVALELILQLHIPALAPLQPDPGKTYRRLVVLDESAGELALLADDAKGVIHLVVANRSEEHPSTILGQVSTNHLPRNDLIRCETTWNQSLVYVLDGAAVVAAAFAAEAG